MTFTEPVRRTDYQSVSEAGATSVQWRLGPPGGERDGEEGRVGHGEPERRVQGAERRRRARAASVHPTQRDAIDAARDIAQTRKSELIVQDQHGRIRQKGSFGNDSCPPKDKK